MQAILTFTDQSDGSVDVSLDVFPKTDDLDALNTYPAVALALAIRHYLPQIAKGEGLEGGKVELN